MDTLGWQALLAAEMSPPKGLALLRELGSLSCDWASAIQKHPSLSSKERERACQIFPDKVAKAEAAGVRVIARDRFPESMQALPFPPALFAWGDFECAHAPAVAIVGTRAATTYGKAAAMKFAEVFARAGVTVVSGGALGIDAAAHKGALAAGGKTVAVLAGGIEQVYPAVHGGLFMQIRESGCLVSQHAIGSRPNGFRFLNRNHLIAGLSLGVVVIEAPERSGALSTVHAANDQGKQVFVVPANIDNLNFKGSHALIRDGATLVDHPDQVLESFGIVANRLQAKLPEASETGSRILAALAGEPLSAEIIVERSGLETSEVMAELTMLEIDGRIMRDGGKYAVKP
ncbi:MAG TPA: DNA-processing protein DprA [Fimbriimonadaceae bacterium]|nr:DNA-processing protein DprA [Fimbriimonadaceae bacterium]